MARLSIRLFGSFEVALEGKAVTGFASDKVRALLVYLAVESDRPHRREALAGLLWPGYPETSARANLRRSLANLRTVLGDRQASPPFLSISRQTIRLACQGEAWCDVAAFCAALEAARSSEQTDRHLEEAVSLYRGSLLAGFSLADSVEFEEWLLLRRERLRREALVALRRLASQHEAQGLYGKALPYAQRQVDLEPLQEEAHRQLMRLLALNGQRGLAVAQYEACRQVLANRLDVEPAVETTQLYEQIRKGEAVFDQTMGQGMDQGARATSEEASLPHARHGTPLWRQAGVKWALIGGGLLLLAVAIMQVVLLIGMVWPERALPTTESFVRTSPAGKVVMACQDVTPPQICVLDLHDGQSSQITDFSEFEGIDSFTWAPNGQQIVFDAGPIPQSGNPCRRQLYVIGADGSGLRQLARGERCDHMPAWSPDGDWIAFNRDQELWLIHPDGSEAHHLFGETGEFCVGELNWSPNGRQIAFLGQECPPTPAIPNREVWVIDSDGSGPRMVHSFERTPDWASVYWDQNGLAIVCDHAYGDEGSRLLRIDSKGIGEPFLIDVLPPNWHPTYWPQWGKLE